MPSSGGRLGVNEPPPAAMTTALVSMLTKIPVRADVAMTGEVTLRGPEALKAATALHRLLTESDQNGVSDENYMGRIELEYTFNDGRVMKRVYHAYGGDALLAAYATLLGELVAGLLFMTHKSYYHELQDKMIHMHNVSVDALHQSDKESYLAANKLAQEAFGKTFFSEATLGIASIVPAPFALAWLDMRFKGIPLLTVPIVHHELSYPFVFLLLYIFFRIVFSKWKKHLPFFRTIHAIKLKAKEARGPIRRFIPDAPNNDQP